MSITKELCIKIKNSAFEIKEKTDILKSIITDRSMLQRPFISN
jgi:hypothetical protein